MSIPGEVAPALVVPIRRSRVPRDWRILVGGGGVACFVLAAVLAPVVAPYGPEALATKYRFMGPSAAHLLGTDDLGRDILSRILFGLRPSIVSGLIAVALAAVLGVLIGIPAGYFGRWIDEATTRVLDLFVAWPAVFLALAIVLLFGGGEVQVIFAIGFGELPVFARLARSIALVSSASEHVLAARSLGASRWRIMSRHIFPFVIIPLVVQFAVAAPQAIVTEASLNFLGLGTQPPHPSLGAMVSEGQNFISYSAGGVVYPIVAIALLVTFLTMLADGLQNSLDPRRHQAET